MLDAKFVTHGGGGGGGGGGQPPVLYRIRFVTLLYQQVDKS